MLIPEINSGFPLLANDSNSIYSYLKHWHPGLLLDVGASNGFITRKMLNANPESRLIAFEPFPGNFKYFESNIGDDTRVRLIKKAVSNKSGRVPFYVSSVVEGNEKGWEHMQGYSSVGRIVDEGVNADNIIHVESCCLDDIINEKIRLCKIDVQGAELDVLYGASKAIQRYGVDVFFIELGCGNELEILEYINKNNYFIFDGPYLIIALNEEPDRELWWNISDIQISTGKKAYYGRPKNAPRAFPEYCRWLKHISKKIGYVGTDIICINRDFMHDFMKSVGQSKELVFR